ncbi:MAG: hypothetical protein KF799_09575 [Bdellovibrionales bacterium]|nr:hypothetical protein [Bdellovibrionales bacterium]
MVRFCFTAFFYFTSVIAWGQVATVDTGVFTAGRQWTWVYSSADSGAWSPYLREVYTVVERNGSRATVIMQSGSLHKPLSEPHHKFIVDLDHCERQKRDPSAKGWTVVLYTKSFGSSWELVSNTHSNLVFTEKFNCASSLPGSAVIRSELEAAGQNYAIFQFEPAKGHPASWYFSDRQGLEGTAALKMFPPRGDYKFEFDVSFASCERALE